MNNKSKFVRSRTPSPIAEPEPFAWLKEQAPELEPGSEGLGSGLGSGFPKFPDDNNDDDPDDVYIYPGDLEDNPKTPIKKKGRKHRKKKISFCDTKCDDDVPMTHKNKKIKNTTEFERWKELIELDTEEDVLPLPPFPEFEKQKEV